MKRYYNTSNESFLILLIYVKVILVTIYFMESYFGETLSIENKINIKKMYAIVKM